MSSVTRRYLKELKAYAAQVQVPGLDRASEPIALDEIYVDPRVRAIASDRASGSLPRREIDLEPERSQGDEEFQSASQRVEPAQRIASRPAPEPASNVLTSYRRLVLLGEPGQGKSTLLRRYVGLLVQDLLKDQIPLLVELGRLRSWPPHSEKNFQWLFDRLPDVLRQILGDQGLGEIRENIRAGRMTILLDGLDELEPEAQRGVRELVLTLGNNRIILTSRPHVYRLGPLSGFKAYEIMELQSKQSLDLAGRVSRALARQFGVDHVPVLAVVEDAIQSTAAEMAGNPLLVSIMCLTASGRQQEGTLQEFPTRPAPLIGECVDALVQWQRKHKASSQWPDHLDEHRVVAILGPLAFSSFKNKTGLIRGDDLAELEPAAKQDLMEHLVSARFIEQRHRNYAFVLETFREYFAARAIAACPDPYRELKPYLHRPEWQRVVLYTAGSLSESRASKIDIAIPTCTWLLVKGISPVVDLVSNLVGQMPLKKPLREIAKTALGESGLLKGPLEKWLHRSRHSTEFFITSIWKRHCTWHSQKYERVLMRDLRLATRCLGAVAECPPSLVNRILKSVVGNYRWPDSAFKNAIREAARLPAAFQWLTNPPIYKTGVTATMRTQEGEFEIEGVVIPQVDTGREARRCATSSLAGVARRRDVQRLLLKLICFMDSYTADEAAEGLAGVASEPWIEASLLDLSRSESSELREDATNALSGRVDQPRVQERMLELTRDEEGSVRSAAAVALSGVATQPDVWKRLLEMGRDTYLSARWSAARTLSRAADGPAVQSQLLELSRHEDDSLRAFAAICLVEVAAQPLVLQRLLEMTEDPSSAVREQSALALSGVATYPLVLQTLLKLTYDSTGEVWRYATDSLTTAASHPAVLHRLLELVTEGSWLVQTVGARALAGAANNPEVYRTLLRLTKAKDFYLRIAAANALASAAARFKVGIPQSVPRRIKVAILNESFSLNRLEAAEILEKLVQAREVQKS